MVLPILGTRQLEDPVREIGVEVYSAVQGNGSTGANKNAISRGMAHDAKLLSCRSMVTEYSRNSLGDKEVIDGLANTLADFYHIPEAELKNRMGLFVGAQQGEVAFALAVGNKLGIKNKLDVYVQVPGYPNYKRTLKEGLESYFYYGSKVADLNIDDELGYATAEQIEGSIFKSHSEDRKPIILLTIPSNPQGKSPPRQEMRKIVHMLNNYPDVYTLIDQAFLEMDFTRKFETFTDVLVEEGLTDLEKRFAYSRTNTKAGGLPTERGNVVVLPDDKAIVRSVSNYINVTIFNSSVHAQHTLWGFLEDFHINQAFCIDAYLPAYERNYTTISGALNRSGIKHSKPDAGFFTVVDFSSLRGMKVPPEMLEVLRQRPVENDEILLANVDIPDGVIKTDLDIFNLLLYVGNPQTKKAVSTLPGNYCGYALEDCKVRFCFGMTNQRLVEVGQVIESLVSKVKQYNQDKILPGPRSHTDWAKRQPFSPPR